MSQGYHHGDSIYSFPNGFERSEHHQILREKFGGGIPASDESSDAGIPSVYDTAGMLSEMFSYPATQLLHQMGPPGYQNPRQPQPPVIIQEWYTDRKDPNILEFRDVSSSVQSVHVDQHQQRQHNQQQQLHHMSDISVADSAASAMQLFLMNPQSRTSSTSPGQVSSTSHINTIQMLLPSNSNTSQFNSWGGGGGGGGGGKVQGLSLSLASSIEAAKAEQLFFTQHHQQYQHFNHQMNNNGIFVGPSMTPSSSTLSSMNILRNSKYAKPTQELLEEFCSVGRGNFKKNKFKFNNLNPNNTDKDQTEATSSGGGGGASLSSATKEGSKAPPPTLSAAERAEHQRKKVKLLAMLDEVDRRYSHYCEQMQLVVNSFDLVMGFGSALPYTALAQKAMSRHFRCLKDTIGAQLKRSCELLGEKDAASSGGVTKGETPRLRIIEQSLRQQRAFNQMGMMETEAWRPQRGLPERSVNILRAWLFENFLHPYPSDADKHLLARQTGLSRSQVSNWFINARVRLWKPMVEEMYQQEAKEEEEQASDQNLDNATSNNDNMNDQNDLLDSSSQQDQTRVSSSHNFYTSQQAHNMIIMSSSTTQPQDYYNRFHVEMMAADDHHRRYRESGSSAGTILSTTSGGYNIGGGSGLIRFGTTSTAAGDVSLTLGLRQHSGNLPEKNSFSVREFGGC